MESSDIDSCDDIVVVGIDFGTTYSGVSWAYSGEPDSIEVVSSWNSHFRQCSDVEKCPTQLHYGDRGQAAKWGYGVSPEKEAIRWFKLLLLDEGDVPDDIAASSHMRSARKMLGVLDKDPIQLISAFLRHLWNHAMDSIGDSIGDALLETCKFHVVVTLPAIWPIYAQQRMRRAVEASGILQRRRCGQSKLSFITEPEAAALATLKDLSRRNNTRAGDTIVVCDAGGGTVDLISYEIMTLTPFTIRECVKGDGGLCGGVFLDEGFLNLIRDKVGSTAWNKVIESEKAIFLNNDWEHGIKSQFLNQDRSWLVSLPESCQDYGDDNTSPLKRKRKTDMQLSSPEILSVYTPIVDSILKLVKVQCSAIKDKYHKEPRFVVLVGGFGRSRFLLGQLRAAMSLSTEVLQSRGSKPWTAISRGAVIHGLAGYDLSQDLNINISTRIVRASYGICFMTKWDKFKHLKKDKEWCDIRRNWQANNQMKWFLRQGEDVSTKMPVRRPYVRYVERHSDHMEQSIYTSSAREVPCRKDESVKQLCTITWTQRIDFENLPTWTNPVGKVYRRLNYEVEMTCEQGAVDFTVYFEGKRVGGQNVQVEWS